MSNVPKKLLAKLCKDIQKIHRNKRSTKRVRVSHEKSNVPLKPINRMMGALIISLLGDNIAQVIFSSLQGERERHAHITDVAL
jgi:hypothetical protein